MNQNDKKHNKDNHRKQKNIDNDLDIERFDHILYKPGEIT